jgi:hypothetical protein
MSLSREPNSIETLPNGTVVRFWDSIGVDGKSQRRAYRVDGRKEVWPSVSTIAGIFEIPALMPKAVKMQEEAVIALAQSGVDIAGLTQPELRDLLKRAGTHYDSIWGVARERGDIAHDMLLKLVAHDEIPRREDYAPDIWEWIRAGVTFIHDEDPELIDAEYFVASSTYQFAGRGDLLYLARKGPRKGKIVRADYKSLSAWSYEPLRKDEEPPGRLRPPYDENLIALAGYELGAVESGYLPSDVQIVVRLGPDGNYEVTESHATPEVFLAAKTAHREKGYLTKPRPVEVSA